MRVNILCEDINLIEKLRDIRDFKLINIDERKINDKNADLLIVSNRVIGINRLLSVKSDNTNCIYLSSSGDYQEVMKIDKNILDIKKITIIPPRRSVEQIFNGIVEIVFGKNEENNVFSFFGTDVKVGTTSIARNIASELAKRNSGKKIVLINLDGQIGWTEERDIRREYSIANIKISLKNKILFGRELENSCYKCSHNFYILYGDNNLDESIYYHQDEIDELIRLCKENFDFVIIDVGSIRNLYLRMTYSGLINSDNKILITDQTPRAYELFQEGEQQVLDYLDLGKFKFVIINKYIKGRGMPKKEYLSEKYKIPVLRTFPMIDFYYRIDIERNVGLFNIDKEYRKGILSIVKFIENKQGIDIHKMKSKKLFGILGA